jgi:hypothetical protein
VHRLLGQEGQDGGADVASTGPAAAAPSASAAVAEARSGEAERSAELGEPLVLVGRPVASSPAATRAATTAARIFSGVVGVFVLHRISLSSCSIWNWSMSVGSVLLGRTRLVLDRCSNDISR